MSGGPDPVSWIPPLDAKWGHIGADHWVEGRPTEERQGAALDLSAARRKPELFVSGECLAEGPPQTLQTMLREAVHALAHVRGVKDTSRGGKYHNKREFVALAGELGLAWPQGQQPHPVIGFSEVQLAEPDPAWVPEVRVERIAEASHWVQADAPERVNQLMVDFL